MLTNRFLNQLEKELAEYEKVFLFLSKNGEKSRLISKFCQSKAVRNTRKKILVLTKEIPKGAPENISVRRILEEEEEQLARLYYMYEFADHFLLVSEDYPNYASLFHFVDTGVLSLEEAFEALLV